MIFTSLVYAVVNFIKSTITYWDCMWYESLMCNVRTFHYLLHRTDPHWAPLHHHIQSAHLQVHGRHIQGVGRIQLAAVDRDRVVILLKCIFARNRIWQDNLNSFLLLLILYFLPTVHCNHKECSKWNYLYLLYS